MSSRVNRGVGFRTTVAALITVPFIVPFVFLISTAVRERSDYVSSPGGLPKSFTLDHIVESWQEADLGRALINTLIMCVVACIVCGTTSLAGGYFFRVARQRWTGPLRLLLGAGYAIPMVAWLIPVFVIAAQAGWTGNLFVAGVISGVSSLPFGFYFVHTFLQQSLSDEVIEATTLDGAGVFRAFFYVGIPMAMPALSAVLALTFVWSFGDLLIASTLLQSNTDSYTLTLAATTLTTREDINLQGQAAAALVSLLPTLIVFAVAQKALKQGFGGGSEK
ncbi:carbohydrate ABC transporter permease [Leucobacter sp. NPDC015123]|uniref:carbohydrate ABC transporter permease n=1 Tax=Leucobacter sp. NPDC015123 TaxID=3364129 RepID=UPI0036F488CC